MILGPRDLPPCSEALWLSYNAKVPGGLAKRTALKTLYYAASFLPGISYYGWPRDEMGNPDIDSSHKGVALNALRTIKCAAFSWKTQIPIVLALSAGLGVGVYFAISVAMQRIPQLGHLLAKIPQPMLRKGVRIGTPIAGAVTCLGAGVCVSLIIALIHNRIAAGKQKQVSSHLIEVHDRYPERAFSALRHLPTLTFESPSDAPGYEVVKGFLSQQDAMDYAAYSNGYVSADGDKWTVKALPPRVLSPLRSETQILIRVAHQFTDYRYKVSGFRTQEAAQGYAEGREDVLVAQIERRYGYIPEGQKPMEWVVYEQDVPASDLAITLKGLTVS